MDNSLIGTSTADLSSSTTKRDATKLEEALHKLAAQTEEYKNLTSRLYYITEHLDPIKEAAEEAPEPPTREGLLGALEDQVDKITDTNSFLRYLVERLSQTIGN